jgi:hypothetical protein
MGSSKEVVASRSVFVRAAKAERQSSGDVLPPGAKCISGSHTEWSPRRSAQSTQ